MILEAILLLLGLGFLVFCADKLVGSATTIASKLGVSQFLIGLTVVSLGTALPELATSTIASLQGHSLIALGNAIGSNIANLGLVLGVAGMTGGMVLKHNPMHQKEALGVFVLSALLFALALDGVISQTDSLVLFILLGIYLYIIGTRSEEQHEEYALTHPHADKKMGFHATSIIIAGIGLWLGARLVVYGATALSYQLGVGEGVIGMTIVAVGTSLPELTVALQAAKKKQGELVLGDLLGACIINILFVLGIASAIQPIYVTIPMLVSIPVAATFAGAVWIFLRTNEKITRAEGAILLGAYVCVAALIGLFV